MANTDYAEILAQLRETFAEMEKLLRQASAEFALAIREQVEKEKTNE